MESLVDLFRQLSLSNDKIKILSQIRTLISSASNDELWSVMSNLQLVGIYENINAADSDQLECYCAILDRLFSVLDVNVLLNTFISELLLGLSHNLSAVNEISLNQVARVANVNVQLLGRHAGVLQKVAELIGSTKDENVSKKACAIFICLGESSDGLELIFDSKVLAHLTDATSKDDSTRYRVLEMVVDIALLSDDALLHCSESFLLQSLLNDLNKKDILIQLNCLELLSKLSLCDHGFQYLEMTGTFRCIEQVLTACDEDPLLALLLIPGIFKFFGSICHVRPKEMCMRFELFIRKMFGAIDPNSEVDSTLTDTALDSVGIIGFTPDGKMALEKHHDFMVITCRTIGRLLTNVPSDRRSRALDVIAQLMHLEVASQTTELLSLTKEWFDLLSESDPLKLILAIVKQPFPELHVPALRLIKSLARLPWGQEYLNSQPGFEEYLLDRNTETTKEGMERKYDIVRTLVNSPTVSSIFSSESILRLKSFELQGPFYVQAQSLVAFESS